MQGLVLRSAQRAHGRTAPSILIAVPSRQAPGRCNCGRSCLARLCQERIARGTAAKGPRKAKNGLESRMSTARCRLVGWLRRAALAMDGDWGLSFSAFRSRSASWQACRPPGQGTFGPDRFAARPWWAPASLWCRTWYPARCKSPTTRTIRCPHSRETRRFGREWPRLGTDDGPSCCRSSYNRSFRPPALRPREPEASS